MIQMLERNKVYALPFWLIFFFILYRFSWCNTCRAWKNELNTYHRRHKQINWKKMHSQDWPKNQRNIAQIFIPSGWDTVKINLGDLSTQLAIWSVCKEVPGHVNAKAKVLREQRNNIAHANYILSKAEKTITFQEINNIIRDPDISPTIADFNEFCSLINDLDNNKLNCLENEISSILTEIRAARKETNGLLYLLKQAIKTLITKVNLCVLSILFLAFAVVVCPVAVEHVLKFQNSRRSEYRQEGKLKNLNIYVDILGTMSFRHSFVNKCNNTKNKQQQDHNILLNPNFIKSRNLSKTLNEGILGLMFKSFL